MDWHLIKMSNVNQSEHKLCFLPIWCYRLSWRCFSFIHSGSALFLWTWCSGAGARRAFAQPPPEPAPLHGASPLFLWITGMDVKTPLRYWCSVIRGDFLPRVAGPFEPGPTLLSTSPRSFQLHRKPGWWAKDEQLAEKGPADLGVNKFISLKVWNPLWSISSTSHYRECMSL